MPRVDLTLHVEIERTPRVVQLEGIFDLPDAKMSEVEFHFDVPLEAREWQIGLVVGPSGAGKSSVARHLFGDAMVAGYDWDPRRAVVDGFVDAGGAPLPVHHVQQVLNSVGFSSPPSWLRPFRVLSNGEQFRATMARALVDPRQLIVIDEFTSVIDRQVAKVGASAIAKAVRRTPGKQFVAVSCHDDIIDWLQPDWTLEPHAGRFAWRCLRRRPAIDLRIVRVEHKAWSWFAHHHYLSRELHRGAKCFVGLVEDRPVAFASMLHFPHPTVRGMYVFNRIVVLPDWQGLGIGAGAFLNAIAAIGLTNGKRVIGAASHPGQIMALAKSPWVKMTKSPSFPWGRGAGADRKILRHHDQRLRRTAHFEHVGPYYDGAAAEVARRLWEG